MFLIVLLFSYLDNDEFIVMIYDFKNGFVRFDFERLFYL